MDRAMRINKHCPIGFESDRQQEHARMDVFIAFVSILDEPRTIPLSILFILMILETERRWVRARRRRGFRYSPLSHLFDTLIVLLGLIALAAIVRAILASTMVSLIALLAPLAWAIGLVLLLAIGISLIRRFASTPDQSTNR
jgi:small-conductance mechanosensitive channel